MSHPMSGYGGYGYNSSNGSSAQMTYSAGGGTQSTASSSYPEISYHSDTRPALQQYPGQEHNWPSQNQQNHGSNTAHGSESEAWRGSSTQQGNYDYETDYSRQSGHQAQQKPSSNIQTHHRLSIATSKPASTQALSSLAYASGVESAGINNRSNSCFLTRTSSTPISNYIQNASSQPHRANSPTLRSSQSNTSLQPPSVTSQTANHSNASQQSLAVSAVQALAGVANRRQQSQQISTLSTMGSTLSQSSQPFPGPTPQYGTGPYDNQHNRQKSAQVETSYDMPFKNAAGSSQSHQPSKSSPTPDSHMSLNNGGRQAKAPAQLNGNIANLVSKDDHHHSQSASTFNPPSPQPTEMPSYIDPSKVFNPYHREHERRKREMAEAEAEEKRQAAMQDAAKPPVPSPIVDGAQASGIAAVSQTDTVMRDIGTVAATSERQQQERSTADKDLDMAAEMKLMIERMRKLKDKDPSMFTKLWEDMRKGTSGQVSSLKLPLAPPVKIPIVPVSTSSTVEASIPKTTPGANSSSVQASNSEPAKNGFFSPANGYYVVVENNAEGLPDLGRFPAERRFRASYKKMPNDFPQLTSSPHPLSSPESSDGPIAMQNRSVQLPLPSSGQQPKGSTVWPEAKRKALADVATKTLNSNAENIAIGITANDIHAMLEQNPSYLDLCQMLEDKGLKFHRGQFARSLLTNVPGLTSTSNGTSVPPAAAPQTSSAVTPSQFVSPVHGVVARVPPRYPVSVSSHPQSMQGIKGERMIAPRFVAYKAPQAPQARFGIPTPSIAPPKLGSKEAMARKRNFSELVDLTLLSDSEDYVTSQKQARIHSPSPEPNPLTKQLPVVPILGLSSSFRGLQNSDLSLLPPVQRPKMILARKINKSEALRKSYYDPKTVARDILIAAGRHPSERPLNAHLGSLLGVYVEVDSDLSTFDWDAVDPGGPTPPKVEAVDIPAVPPIWKPGDRAKRRERVRGVVEDDNASERRGRRIGDPENVGPATNISRLTAQTQQLLHDSLKTKEREPSPSRLRHSYIVDEKETRDEQNVIPQKRKASSQISVEVSPPTHFHRSPKSASKQASEAMEASVEPSFKRRGRPPGSKNKQASLNTLKETSRRLVPATRRESPPPPTFTVYKCRWRSCGAQLHNLPTLRKHIAKVHKPLEDEPFVCWWKKCDYLVQEAGNIKPVKVFDSNSDWLDHIEDAHLHPIGMKYGDGPSTTHIGKPEMNFDVSKFLYQAPVETITRTVSYLDPQSLIQDRVKYLSDEYGRTAIATASKEITDEHPADALALSSVTAPEFMHFKGYEAAHRKTRRGDKNDKVDVRKTSEDILRAMEVRKEAVGPGIDRGGCTLVNDARRDTLVQNAGIIRPVDYDY